MDIAVSLDRDCRRDLRLNAGDEVTLNVTVYAVDGDHTPLGTVTGLSITTCPSIDAAFPVGSEFTVSDRYDRFTYRLTGDVGATHRTLCWGTIVVRGANHWPFWGNDYGGPWA